MSNRGSKKKEIHQNLTLKMMGSSDKVQLWRYSHRRALFLPQKSPNGAKKRVSHGTPKNFQRSNERVFSISKIQISIINCKIKSILSGLVTRRLYFLKKYDAKQTFSPSCRNWPIWGEVYCNAMLAPGLHLVARGGHCLKGSQGQLDNSILLSGHLAPLVHSNACPPSSLYSPCKPELTVWSGIEW